MRRFVRCFGGIVLVLFLVLPTTAAPPPATMVVSPDLAQASGPDVSCDGDGGPVWLPPQRRPYRVGSSCAMAPRLHFSPWLPGSYYFRPYHHSHVSLHQMYGELWGEDPATPYANRLFQRVYQEYRQSEGF